MRTTLRRSRLIRLELIVALVLLMSGGVPSVTTWAQDSGATSFTIASANGNVVIKRTDGSAEVARPGSRLTPGDELASIGRSEATVNLGSQSGGNGASLSLFSDTTVGVRSAGAGGGGFFVADLASGVVLARTLPGSNATVQITNEAAGAVAQFNPGGGMAVATDVGTGSISVSCETSGSQVAFPYTDMRVPCEQNVVRTLSNRGGSIEDAQNDSGSSVTSAVAAAGNDTLGTSRTTSSTNSTEARERERDNTAPLATTVGCPSAPLSEAGGVTLIGLTWRNSVDLDAHVSGPIASTSSRFHLYWYANQTGVQPVTYASLSNDVRPDLCPLPSGVSGTETVTLKANPATGQFVPGQYRFWVHNYTHWVTHLIADRFIGTTSAQVTIRRNGQTLATYNVARATGDANADIWQVVTVTLDTAGTPVLFRISQLRRLDSDDDPTTTLCVGVQGNCGMDRTK